MASHAAKTILVAGATGKQGGAALAALLDLNHTQPDSPFHILALTRSASSPKARALAAHPNVTVVDGTLDDCPAIFAKAGRQVWGVFSVQGMGRDGERQGKALVDAAVSAGVQHVVYSSVDRGGKELSDRDPTDVPHFASKYNIEKHLEAKALASPQKMTWTVLRPVFFMENITPDFVGKTIATLWADMPTKPSLQLISVRDIGHFAAHAFLAASLHSTTSSVIEASKPNVYINTALSLAGDSLTFTAADAVFARVVGHGIPRTFSFLGSAFRAAVADMGKMFAWFERVGYGADIGRLRTLHPGLLDFETWLKSESEWKSGRRALENGKANSGGVGAGTVLLVTAGLVAGAGYAYRVGALDRFLK